MSRFVAGSSPLTGSMLGPLRSDGTAIGAIRSPRGVKVSNQMSPRRRRRCRDARREGSSGPYRKFSTTVIATPAGQQEKLLRPARWAQASSRFQSSRGGMGGSAMSVANRLKTWGQDFLGIGEQVHGSAFRWPAMADFSAVGFPAEPHHRQRAERQGATRKQLYRKGGGGKITRSRQGRPSLIAPRTDPYERNYRIRLLPRMSGVKVLLGARRLTLGHSFPAQCRARAGFCVVLLGLRPSLHILRRDACLFVRPLHRYYGAVSPLPGVRVRLVAIRLPGPVCFRRHQGGLPVLVHIVSRRAWGLRLRRARPWLAPNTPLPLGRFPRGRRGATTVSRFA